MAGMICKQRLKFGMRERVQVGAQVGGRVSVLFECYVADFWVINGTPDKERCLLHQIVRQQMEQIDK